MAEMENTTTKTEIPTTRKRKTPCRVRGVNTLRTQHCSRLNRLLNQLIQQRNWKQACGVLSVLLKGSAMEKFPKENRNKYLAAMELLNKLQGDHHVKTWQIYRVFRLWVAKNGPMKKSPVKDKISVRLEFILFCLTRGNIEDAHQQTIRLMQETEYGSDPVLNMMAGLIYYELWYYCIPEEMKLKSSDIYDTPMVSDLSELDSCNPVESTCSNSVDDINSPAHADSASSIGNNKSRCIESVDDMQREPSTPIFQPQDFYIADSDEEMCENETVHHYDNLADTFRSYGNGFDAGLLPIRLTELNEGSIYIYTRTLKDNYSKAVKHLRFALYSTPPVLASLLPLVQLLLLGGQVEEALKELEKICQTSNAVLPSRIRAILMDRFGSKLSVPLFPYYEDVLKRDPTCSQSLSWLISMHKNGDYGTRPLLEMIALHLEATYGSCSVWEKLAACFLELSQFEEDQISACGNANEGVNKMLSTSTEFLCGDLKKTWELRCRWWSTRHFSKNSHVSDLKAGEWEVLTYKAACASHMYGPESDYVVSVLSYLEKREKRKQILLLQLQLHMGNSFRVSEQAAATNIPRE